MRGAREEQRRFSKATAVFVEGAPGNNSFRGLSSFCGLVFAPLVMQVIERDLAIGDLADRVCCGGRNESLPTLNFRELGNLNTQQGRYVPLGFVLIFTPFE